MIEGHGLMLAIPLTLPCNQLIEKVAHCSGDFLVIFW